MGNAQFWCDLTRVISRQPRTIAAVNAISGSDRHEESAPV